MRWKSPFLLRLPVFVSNPEETDSNTLLHRYTHFHPLTHIHTFFSREQAILRDRLVYVHIKGKKEFPRSSKICTAALFTVGSTFYVISQSKFNTLIFFLSLPAMPVGNEVPHDVFPNNTVLNPLAKRTTAWILKLPFFVFVFVLNYIQAPSKCLRRRGAVEKYILLPLSPSAVSP